MEKINQNNNQIKIENKKEEKTELNKKIEKISSEKKDDIKILQSNQGLEIKDKEIKQLDTFSEKTEGISPIIKDIIQDSSQKKDHPIRSIEHKIPPEKEGIKEFKTFKAFDSYIEKRVNDLKGVQGDVEKIEIVGDIAESILKAGGQFSIEKIEKNAEKISEKIKSIEKIVSGVKEAAPFLESLKILVPILQIGRIRKGVEECNSTIKTIEEQLEKEPENINLKQELIKTKLHLSKLKQMEVDLLLEEKGIVEKLDQATKLAVEKLTPILPQGEVVFEYIGPISDDISFVLDSASSGIKVKQKYESIKLLKSLKEVLKIKLEELKSKPKDLKIIKEIKEKEKEIEQLEKEILSEKIDIATEGFKTLNSIFNQIESFLPIGIEGSSKAIEILGNFSVTISLLTNVPNLAKKGKQIVQRFENIHKLRIQATALNTAMTKLSLEIQVLEEELPFVNSNSAVNHVFKQIESKKILLNFIKVQQNAIHAVGIGNEILNLSEDLMSMLSSGGKLGESALLLLGVSKAMIASLGPASLGLVIGGVGLKATKFLLQGTAIVPKILEERKVNKQTSKTNKEFEKFIQSVSLFTKDILPLHFDQKNQVLHKSDVVKCIGNTIERVHKQLLIVNKKYMEMSKKLESMNNETLTKNFNSLSLEKKKLENLFISVLEYSQHIHEMNEIDIKDHNELVGFKMSFMKAITEKRLGYFHSTYQEISNKKEEITKNYNEKLKLDRMGLSKNDYREYLDSLSNCLESESVTKEFSKYFKKTNPDIHEAIFNQGLTKEKQAQALLDFIFEYEL